MRDHGWNEADHRTIVSTCACFAASAAFVCAATAALRSQSIDARAVQSSCAEVVRGRLTAFFKFQSFCVCLRDRRYAQLPVYSTVTLPKNLHNSQGFKDMYEDIYVWRYIWGYICVEERVRPPLLLCGVYVAMWDCMCGGWREGQTSLRQNHSTNTAHQSIDTRRKTL